MIGLSTAYYLSRSQSGRDIVIVESAPSLLLSASGFSGGFLCRDWFSPAVSALADLSFGLHRELANANGGGREWGYSPSLAYSSVVDEVGADGKKTGKVIRGEDWLLTGTSRAGLSREYAASADPNLSRIQSTGTVRDELLGEDGTPTWVTWQRDGSLEKISSEQGCAQVEPRELCEWLLKECEKKGVRIRLNTRLVKALRNVKGEMKGIVTDKGKIECKNIVIAAGSWTPRVFDTIYPGMRGKVRIDPLAGYSIVVRSQRYNRPIMQDDAGRRVEMAHSIFCPPGPKWTYSPEAMARMTRDGKPEIYVAGLNSTTLVLPELASGTKALIDRSKLEELKQTVVALTGLSKGDATPHIDDLEVVREGLCFRPVSATGKPIVMQVEGSLGQGGVYIASGHGPWGITLGLGTGLVVSEMLQGQQTSADISGLGLGPTSRL